MSYAAAIMSFLIVAMMLMSELTVVQSQQQSPNDTQGEYKVIKSKNSEQFVFPYSSSNSDRKHPFIYTFDVPKVTNWILTIQNNMSYSEMQNTNAKTIVKLKEPTQSDKFIEIAMFGDASKKFWVAVNTRESGYIRVYEQDNDGWSRDEPVIVAHANNQGLTITNGKRIIIDRLSINDFTLASIAVYGKEDPDSAVNTYKGNISFNVVYGSPADSPLYYFPLAMIVGIGGLVACLLVFKKRKTSSEEQTQHQ
jgi:hypothetical protein